MVNLYHRSNFSLSPSFYVEMFHVSDHLRRPENGERLKLNTVHGFTHTKTAVIFIHVRKIDHTRHCSILDRSKAIGYWRSPDRYCGAKNASNCHPTLPGWQIWARITRISNFLPFDTRFRPLFLTFYNITDSNAVYSRRTRTQFIHAEDCGFESHRGRFFSHSFYLHLSFFTKHVLNKNQISFQMLLKVS